MRRVDFELGIMDSIPARRGHGGVPMAIRLQYSTVQYNKGSSGSVNSEQAHSHHRR